MTYTRTQKLMWTFDSLHGLRPVAHEHPVDTKIESFAHLREGWRYGEGGPVSLATIYYALEWRKFLSLHGATKIAAVPGAGREIVIAATIGGEYTEIIIEPDGTVTVIRDQCDREEIYKSDLSMTQAKILVQAMSGKAWTIFGGSIRMSSSTNTVDSLVPPSRTPEGRIFPEVYRWLTTSAPQPVAYPSAITHGSTTERPIPLVSPPYFGNLMRPYYPVSLT